MRKIDTIVVHCSDTEAGDVNSIRKYHIQHNGWVDIGYHFVILRDGTIEIGRPLKQAGSHVRGANATSIGICLIGKKIFNDIQFDALRRLVKDLRQQVGLVKVLPHSHFPSAKKQGKTCPNFNVDEVLQGGVV